MPAPIRLSRQQQTDLKQIVSLDLETLKKIVAHLQSLKPAPLQPKQLRTEISTLIPGHEKVADTIIRQMLRLHNLMGQTRLSLDEMFEGWFAGIGSAWKEIEFAAWSQRDRIICD